MTTTESFPVGADEETITFTVEEWEDYVREMLAHAPTALSVGSESATTQDFSEPVMDQDGNFDGIPGTAMIATYIRLLEERTRAIEDGYERDLRSALEALLDTGLNPIVREATATEVLCSALGFKSATEATEALFSG